MSRNAKPIKVFRRLYADYGSPGERVARGAVLLDEDVPGWAESIDLEMLDIACPSYCALGQAFGKFEDGARILRIDEQPEQYGVFVPECGKKRTDEEYERLTDAWVYEVLVRISPPISAEPPASVVREELAVAA